MSRLAECPAKIYRPRRPIESDFHRLLSEHFEEFCRVYHARYSRQFGFWRSIIGKATPAFLKCGDPMHGFARTRCPDCRHEFFVPFSCKQRCICPSCAQKRTILFGLHVANDVCRAVPHRQFVWTIPKRLGIFFRFHRKLLGHLPRLAWETITEIYGSLLGPDARPGGIIAIQTFGSLIHFHPHLHGLITDGAFLPDGRFADLAANLTSGPFLRLWEQKVFKLLLDEGRIEQSLVDQMSSWRHSGFGVDRSILLGSGDKNGIKSLAQYMARCPFSLARLIRITPEGKVLYKTEKDSCQRYPKPASDNLFDDTRRNFQIFEPLDFIAELTQHIPNPGEHLVRYFGVYSNKSRGTDRRASGGGSSAPTPDPDTPDFDKEIRRRWAILIKHIYQVDPLKCPKCGGQMKIISFIEARQQVVIRQILQHCGLWDNPPSRGPPRALPPPEQKMHHQADPDFLEHLHREEIDPPQTLWDF